jgi:hypothetical protein
MEFGINAGISVIILGMTYALISEGLWGAALMFFNILFAGIIAFNFYEPLAALLASNVEFFAGFADTLCMLGLFLVALTLLRLTTETLAPTMVRFPKMVYHAGRIFFAVLASMTLMAIILLSFEAAPVHKKVFGVIDYQTKVPFGLGLDRQWLGFFQHTTGQVFADYRSEKRDPFRQYGNAKVFDPRAEWLLFHQEARPYGTESVLGEEGAEDGGGAPATPPAPGASPAPAH